MCVCCVTTQNNAKQRTRSQPVAPPAMVWVRAALVLAVASLALVAAQEEEAVRVIRFELPEEGGAAEEAAPGALFSQLRPLRRRLLLPTLFSRLFGEEQEQEAAPVHIKVFRVDLGDGADALGGERASSPFGALFSRMHRMVNALNAQLFSNVAAKSAASSHSRCPLVRACSADVDRLCEEAKAAEAADAVPQCLRAHEAELSDRCAVVLRAHLAKHREGHDAEAVAAADGAEAPKQEAAAAAPCASELQELCGGAPAASRDLAALSCLANHKASLSPACLEDVGRRPLFHCALDAQRLCPGPKGRHGTLLCLLKVHERGALTPECSDALAPVLVPAARTTPMPPSSGKVALRMLSADEPAPAAGAAVVTEAAPVAAVASTADNAPWRRGAYRPASVASARSPHRTRARAVPLPVVLGAAGVLLVAIVTVAALRCRRQRRVAEAEVMQLVSPTKGVVDAAPAFVPPPAEQL